MNATAIAVTNHEDVRRILLPDGISDDARYRLQRFTDWIIEEQGGRWFAPSLAGYRDELLGDGIHPNTVQGYLSTIRGRYREILRDNETRRRLFDSAPAGFTFADRKAYADELTTRIENEIDPANSRVVTQTSQDEPDAKHLRLTQAQAEELLNRPGLDNLMGLRDTVMIALPLCTGVREGELLSLEPRDLRQRMGGELALHVRMGKGAKERMIPYGELSWVLAIVDLWLKATGITEGPIVRSFYKGGDSLRPGGISRRTVQLVVSNYPIVIDGKLRTIKPHDLRRTYARRLYDAGVDLVAIQQNLGHADLKTTLGYIGNLDADKRRAPAIYRFDAKRLERFPLQRALEH